MGHIEELRTLVGHRPILMVGAAILIQDSHQRLLLLQRSDSHAWGLPGGAVEPGEVVAETARRETLEETGLEVGELELFGVFSGPDLFYEYPNGDQVYNVTIIFQTRLPHADIRLNGEHIDWNFFPLVDIPSDISPPLIPVIREYLLRQSNLPVG